MATFQGNGRSAALELAGYRSVTYPSYEAFCWSYKTRVDAYAGSHNDSVGFSQTSYSWDYERHNEHAYAVTARSGSYGPIGSSATVEITAVLNSFSYETHRGEGADMEAQITRTATAGSCDETDASKFCVETHEQEWDVGPPRVSTLDETTEASVDHLNTYGGYNFSPPSSQDPDQSLEDPWSDEDVRADSNTALDNATWGGSLLDGGTVEYTAPLKADYFEVAIGSCPTGIGSLADIDISENRLQPVAPPDGTEGWHGSYYKIKWELVVFPEGGAAYSLETDEWEWTGGSRVGPLGDPYRVPDGVIGRVEIRNVFIKAFTSDRWWPHPDYDLWEA